MWTKFAGVADISGIMALSTASGALALCNPGTPHCITDGGPASALSRAKAQINQGNGNLNCDPGPMGVCSDDIPSGSDAKKTPPKPVTPVPRQPAVAVAPAAE